RDDLVTGVQTCALPICGGGRLRRDSGAVAQGGARGTVAVVGQGERDDPGAGRHRNGAAEVRRDRIGARGQREPAERRPAEWIGRSEERRVGKGWGGGGR